MIKPVPVATSTTERSFPIVEGVFRDASNTRVLCVSFENVPSDDELRDFHDTIREASIAVHRREVHRDYAVYETGKEHD